MSPRKKFEEPVSFLFKKMWRFAKGHRHLVVLFLVMSLVANVLTLMQPLVLGELLNEIQRNGFGEHNIWYLTLVIFALLALNLSFWAFHGPGRVIENVTAFRTERNYRQYLISGVLGLGLSWHAQRDSGDTIDKVNKAADGMFRFSSLMFNIIQIIVKAIGTSIILLTFNVPVGILTLILIVIALGVILRFDVYLVPQYKKMNIFGNKISARIFDALSNITTVKVLHIENAVYTGIKDALWAPFELYKRNKKLSETKWFTGSSFFTLITVIPLTLYIWYSYKNNIVVQVGTLSAMFLYLSRLMEVFFAFAGRYDEMIINRTRVANAQELEDAFLSQGNIIKERIPPWNTIQLSNVSFSYEDASPGAPQIDGIDFAFGAGETVALIGESGSGKTTFLSVLHGVHPDARATISFDGNHQRKTNFADIDLATTLVPQEPEVFSASIRENITLELNYSDEDISVAADRAEFSSVIRQLPQGLESVINEKGVNLSGGQKQRLALTRALLFAHGKDIILLDESTSSVDPENEAKIYQNIFEAFGGKTIIASIHKMNLLKYFDRIVMFADGAIVDQGSFDSLLAHNKKFKADWDEYVARSES